MNAPAPNILSLGLHLHLNSRRAILVSKTGDPDDACWLAKDTVAYVPVGADRVEVTLPERLARERGLA